VTGSGLSHLGAPAADRAWPVTIVARWIDPGYSRREWIWELAIVVAIAWMGSSGVAVGGRPSLVLLGMAGIGGVALAWRRFRSHPLSNELILGSERLRVRQGFGAPWFELARTDAGVLFSAETGLDWRDRIVSLTDATGRVVVRMRSVPVPIEVSANEADRSWWTSTMPSGTTPDRPPLTASVTALLGTWWPDPTRRTSIHGNLGGRWPWKEPDLSSERAWDRRQTRWNSLILLALLLFAAGVAIFGFVSVHPADAIAFIPPGLIGIAVSIQGLLP
jgi:hypothetical protein